MVGFVCTRSPLLSILSGDNYGLCFLLNPVISVTMDVIQCVICCKAKQSIIALQQENGEKAKGMEIKYPISFNEYVH